MTYTSRALFIYLPKIVLLMEYIQFVNMFSWGFPFYIRIQTEMYLYFYFKANVLEGKSYS